MKLSPISFVAAVIAMATSVAAAPPTKQLEPRDILIIQAALISEDNEKADLISGAAAAAAAVGGISQNGKLPSALGLHAEPQYEECRGKGRFCVPFISQGSDRCCDPYYCVGFIGGRCVEF